MKNSHLICCAIIFTVVTLLSACTVASDPHRYRADVVYPDAVPPPVVVFTAPPASQYEVVGVPPVSGYFWISGVWVWEGGRHVWHPGYWSAPRPGYTWVPHRWHREGREWRMNGGHWLRSH